MLSDFRKIFLRGCKIKAELIKSLLSRGWTDFVKTQENFFNDFGLWENQVTLFFGLVNVTEELYEEQQHINNYIKQIITGEIYSQKWI